MGTNINCTRLTTLTSFCIHRQPKTTNDRGKIYLMVLENDNQNPDLKYKTDTILKDSLIDLSITKIDLFFTNYRFSFPYYMPTMSIFLKIQVRIKNAIGKFIQTM